MAETLRNLLAQKEQFPFLATLEPGNDLIAACQNKPPAWYMTEFFGYEDALLEFREKLLAPALAFMKGAQKDIYSDGRKFRAIYRDDFRQLDQERAARLEEILAADDCFRANRMPEAKSLLHSLRQEHQDKFAAALNQAQARLEQRKRQLEEMPEFAQLNGDQQKELAGEIDATARRLGEQTTLAGLANLANEFENQGFARLADRLMQLASHTVQAGDQTRLVVSAKNREQTVTPLVSLLPRPDSPFLASESDVDNWLAQVRQKLLDEISQGKKVQI